MNKIIEQYIIRNAGIYKRVFLTKSGKYFIDYGHVIAEVDKESAKDLIKENYLI